MRIDYHTDDISKSCRNQTSTSTFFVNNPYDASLPFCIVASNDSPANAYRKVASKFLPPGTVRVELLGVVPFVPFPPHVFNRNRTRTEAPALEDRPDTLTQLFFGQLPYKASDSMICWLCDHFAQSNVLYIERVMQDKSRKGCMQVFVDESDAERIMSSLCKWILIDETGVWHAQDDRQAAILENYARSKSQQVKSLPFRPLVVERSTSTFVRRRIDGPAVQSGGEAADQKPKGVSAPPVQTESTSTKSSVVSKRQFAQR